VFAVIDGQLRTPRSAALDGMTRRTVLELANELKLDAREADISLDELTHADEAFLTTTAGGILPVTTVNGTRIPGKRPGPITARLHHEYWGRRASGWLSSPALYW